MLLDLLGTNDPEPTIVSSQQSTHVRHTFQQLIFSSSILFQAYFLLHTCDFQKSCLIQNWYKRLRANEKLLIDNRNKFGILRGTNKMIFTTSGNRAQFTGVEDDHKPFERKGKKVTFLRDRSS